MQFFHRWTWFSLAVFAGLLCFLGGSQSAFATISDVNEVATKSTGDRFTATDFNSIIGVLKKAFRDDNDTATDFSDDKVGLGVAQDPSSGSCPSGTTHIDYDGDASVEDGECFEGLQVGKGVLTELSTEVGIHFPAKIGVSHLCDVSGQNCRTPAQIAALAGGIVVTTNPLSDDFNLSTFSLYSGTDPRLEINLDSATTGTIQMEKQLDGTSGQVSLTDLFAYRRTRPTVSVQDGDGYNILYQHENSAEAQETFARAQLTVTDATDATEDGSLGFSVMSGGTLESVLTFLGTGSDAHVIVEPFGTVSDGQTVDNQKNSSLLALRGGFLEGGPTVAKNNAFTLQTIASTTSLGEGRLGVAWLPDGGSSSEFLSLTHDGNFGIGTTTPGSALDVKGTLRLSGATSGFVGLAPAAAAGSTTYTLPAADGTSGQVLTTGGDGTLSWTTVSGGGGGISGIGDAVGSGTINSVLFIGSDGNLAQDNSNFFWDDTNNRLGLGTTSPGSELEVTGTIATSVGLDGVGAVDLDYGSADITDHTFVTDGTGTAEVVLPAGSIDSTEVLDDTIVNADINSSAAIDVSKTALVAGTNISLSTNTLNVDDAFILNTGDVGTGSYDFGGATLEIPNTTVGSLPAAGTVGRIAIVTDGASDADCVTGGGSTQVACMDNGTAWEATGDAGSGGGGISNVVEDTTPQLGGDLDTQGNNITATAAGGLDVNLGTSGGDDFTIDISAFVVEGDNGNVGIGTASPASVLEISEADNPTLTISETNTPSAGEAIALIDLNGKDDGAATQTYGTIRMTASDPTAGSEVGQLDFMVFDGGGTGERVTIKGSDVGISQPSPTAKLDIIDSYTEAADDQIVRIANNTTGQFSVFALQAVADNGGSGNKGAIYFDAGATGAGADNFLAFNTDHQADTDYDMVIDGDGNVGIGTTSPGSELEVTGTIATSVGLDGVGAVDLDYGSADITDHTFVTDGTGTAEIVLPAGSIDSTEILDDTIVNADINSSAAIDVSKTALVAGTNISLSTNTLNVDDAFLLNTGDVGTGSYDFGGATLEIPNTTVSSLPSAGTVGRIAIVTDGASDSDCVTGGGSTQVACMDNGTAWEPTGDSGSGGGISGIGDAVGSGTSGSILFVDSAGNLAQDNSNLFWDNANNRLGVGTTSPGFELEVTGTIATTVGLDGVGAVDLDYGSADITDHTFVTDGTGTAEIVLPAGSIDSTEVLDDTLVNADINSSAAIDVSKTALVAGTNITLATNTLNVDDAFLLNTGDIATGTYDFGGATLEIPNTVVGSLPAAGTVGRLAIVTDGASDTDCVTGGGSTQVACMDNGTAWEATGDAGNDSDWTEQSSPADYLQAKSGGIASNGATLHGTGANTHINLGFGTSETGEDGQNYQYATIVGGLNNTATRHYATVGGGEGNDATGQYATIGGGGNSTASGTSSVIAGGSNAVASGQYSFVGGGHQNTASGSYSVVPGGGQNAAGGDYSFSSGNNMALTSAADRTFVFGHASSVQNIATPNAFLVFPIETKGNLGLGTSSFGTDAASVMSFGNATAPTTSPADLVQLYAEDVGGSSELKVRDEAGNVVVLSDLSAATGITGIGDSVGSGTINSVLFIGSDGNLSEDNSNFFWDDTNNRLGIGTATPSTALDVSGTVTATQFVGGGAGITGIDHGSVTGLGDDDHTQYALLAGRSTGQTLTGGTASGDDLTLKSTSNGTKGTIEISEALGVALNPFGTSSGETTEIRFEELAASGDNYVGFKAADTLGGDQIWTLPTSDGTSGQILSTNGSGVLSWSSASGVSIGDSITSGTSGSVLFVDSAGNLAQDNSNLFWDNANNQLGLGTTSPGTTLEVDGTTAFTPSSTADIAAGTGVTVTDTIMRIQGDGGAVDISADPQIAAGATDGQIVILKGQSDTNTVKFDHGTGLNLTFDSSFTMGAGDILVLVYDSADSEWIEMNRADN